MKDRKRLLPIISPLSLLLIWEVFARLPTRLAHFFAPPSLVLLTIGQMAATGELWEHIGWSLLRVLLGFLVGAAPAVLLGMAMGLVPWVRAAFQPIVSATLPVPKTALLPWIILLLGIGESSRIVIIAIGVFFLVLINTMAGVVNIEPVYLEVGRNFGARGWRFYSTIAFPGALPTIFAGLKLGLGTAFLLIVFAEQIGVREGVGYLIWQAYDTFDIERMFAGLILTSLLGLLSMEALAGLERRLVPWKS
ncbi:MAG: ABC transporter permease [Symbiobacteriia bacterium]